MATDIQKRAKLKMYIERKKEREREEEKKVRGTSDQNEYYK